MILPGHDRDMVYPRRIALRRAGRQVTASALQLLGMLVACGGAAVSLLTRGTRGFATAPPPWH